MQQTSAGSVIVVGGGVAGLICAIELHRAGRSVLVLEAGEDVGGRVRTSIVDGFRVDHGFQVLFTAYPTLASYLDMPSLSLRRFQPAARIVRDGRVSLIGDAMRDPLRDPGLLLDTVLARAVPLGDKLRLLALRRFASALSIDECFSARFDGVSTREFLRGRGFSADVIDGFFAPFYGGIFLDRTLGTSASVLLFTFKMLAEGDTAVPAQGIGAITAQLASQLPAGSVRVGVPVGAIDAADGRVRGVALVDGSRFEANDVVLATDAPAAAVLARTLGIALPVPTGARGCSTVYYSAARSPLPGRALWLQGNPQGVISHAVTLTDVAPEYATSSEPAGSRMLLAATAVGDAADLDDSALDAGARRDIATMAQASGDRGLASEPLTRLAIWRVPYAQFAQPPGWREHRPTISCGVPGLWRASEVLHSSSLEGAARGGRDAARALLQQSQSGHSGHHA
ncbi:MAG: NAD(P)/FAD-dependent oxidoreductase [Gemmatimonadota bacterium]